MKTVTLSRTIDASPDAVGDLMLDLEPFMQAGGFTEVTVRDDVIELANAVGFVRIELTLDVVDDPDALLVYEQRDGIFESMVTRYYVAGDDDATTVTATTEYALDAAFVGPLLDASVVAFQRRRELNAQFDYLEDRASG